MREEVVGGLKVRITGGSDREGGGDGPLVVLLHGFGAPGDDLVPLFRQLDVPREVRFAFPEAPLALGATLGPAYGAARAWWMIDPASLDAAMRGERSDRSGLVPDGLVEARTHVQGVLSGLHALLGVTPEHTVLGGFSQGAMLTMDVALHADAPFAGLALMSGSLIALSEWEPRFGRARGVPILQGHGRADPLLPFSSAERLRDLLRAAGADVRWVEFSGGHTIVGSVLDGLGRLIRDALAPA